MGNRISNMVWEKDRVETYLGIGKSNKYLQDEISKLEDMAYKTDAIYLLVNCGDIDVDSINIGDMTYEDYNIITSSGSVTINEEYLSFYSENEYNEYIKENEIEDAPDWLDFAQENEIYWNTFYNYNGTDIDVEIANRLGLPVIELQDGSSYISISGCGMDLSFQLMYYQALALGRIEEKYATKDKLEWAKINLSKENFKDMISHLGVCIDSSDNKHYN